MEVNSVSSDIPSKRRSRSIIFHHFEFLIVEVFVKSISNSLVFIVIFDVNKLGLDVRITFVFLVSVEPYFAFG